jgi:hypothetical protein
MASSRDERADRGERMRKALESAFDVIETGAGDLRDYLDEIKDLRSVQDIQVAAVDLAARAG